MIFLYLSKTNRFFDDIIELSFQPHHAFLLLSDWKDLHIESGIDDSLISGMISESVLLYDKLKENY